MTTRTAVKYGFDAKTGRMVVEKSAAGESNQAFALGGFEMMREIGLPVKGTLFKETELSVMLAMTLPIDIGYSKVAFASTSLGEVADKVIITELEAIHQFNISYYQQARVFGMRYDHIPVLSVQHDANATPLEQETGVTTEFLRATLSSGKDIHLDRNDSRIAALLDDHDLMRATHLLNDKNHFYRLLNKMGVQFARPASVLVDDIHPDTLTELLACDDAAILALFVRLMEECRISHQGQFDASVDYFIKVAGGAGGNSAESSMCRMLPFEAHGSEFRSVLENIKRRMEDATESRGLHLQHPIAARKANTSNPLDRRNTNYFSPCMTMRIGEHGAFSMGHVGDQVLVNGKDFSGSYWNKSLSDEFIQSHQVHIASLARALASIGYRGNFGTDFVENTHGFYEMTTDGNARINGTDVVFFTYRPLELQGIVVRDAFMGFVHFEADGASFGSALQELCAPYRYSSLRYAGVVLLPKFTPKTLLGEGTSRAVIAIYINPSYEPEKFEEFLRLVQDTKH